MFISVFLLHPHGSPTTFVSVPVEVTQCLLSSLRVPVIPIAMQLRSTATNYGTVTHVGRGIFLWVSLCGSWQDSQGLTFY